MKNRMLVVGLGVLLAALFAFTYSKKETRKVPAKPNFIFILADDLGYGDLGCYGQKRIQTPHLDQMAANGVRFTDFYTGSTVCAPSRCALMTGKHMGHAYVRGNGEIPLRAEDVVIPERLKTVGYTTGMFGKWGLGLAGNAGAPPLKGWDEFYGHTHHVAAHFQRPDSLWTIRDGQLVPEAQPKGTFANEVFTNKALAFLQDHQKEPFFLYLAFTIPHAELHLPPKYLAPYLDQNGQSTFAPEKPWADGQHYGGQPNPKAAYAGLVTSIDDYVGKVLQKLKALGLEENTVVLFASDNGTHVEGGRTSADVEYFQSSGPLRGVKRDLYDGGIRTPLLVQWKGHAPRGKVSRHVGAFWDVPATLYELAGAAAGAELDGISLVPSILQKGTQPRHEYLYWEFYERGFDQAVRQGDWKAVKQRDKGNTLELYNLKTDPGETQNVAAKYPELVARLEQILRQAHVKSPIFPLAKK
ncbi:arylsulfatase [Rhabdobacter roseus]|uniref:Arylsulfatase A-like enzyme n=1 Tax=Rhabdobacter roseus TaxID=1655419 RepID=A0A840TSW0_9BACT|nr:arylsulfatase [Rhabdobacter roseus]MBB5283090.1 arylsulfatase A-like enzyme [Rhabdobacter roseus]